jgi:S-adenosylmethionine synthetase
MTTVIEPLRSPSVAGSTIEVVERKGLGHPDTICDHLSEELSRALSRHYLEQFGRVLHHNVDKSLLVAGRSAPAFGGGRVLEPMDIYLSGRATIERQGKQLPIAGLAEQCSRAWLSNNLHAVNTLDDVRLHCLVRPGSSDLADIFARQSANRVLANDTSCGAGFAPLTDLERLVLAVEQSLNSRAFKAANRETGEDITGAGVGSGESDWLAARPASNGQEKTNLAVCTFSFCGGEWMHQSRQFADCAVGQYSSRNDPRRGAGDPGTTSAAGETWINRVLDLFN